MTVSRKMLLLSLLCLFLSGLFCPAGQRSV